MTIRHATIAVRTLTINSHVSSIANSRELIDAVVESSEATGMKQIK